MNSVTLKQELDALDGHGLIRQATPLPELEYIFKHALVQEAAYASLLKAARSDLHRRVAEVIEQSPDADAAVLALHYAQAGALDKALAYSAQAGDAARSVYANREALTHYATALDLAERMRSHDASTIRLVTEVYANRGRVQEVAGDHAAALDTYRAMSAFADRNGEPAVRVEAMNRLNTVLIVARGASSLPLGVSDLDAAHHLAMTTGDPLLIGRALWNYGLFYRFGDPLRAERYLQQARATALDAINAGSGERDERLLDLAANAALDSMIAMLASGQFRKALDYGTRAMNEYRALDNKQFLADAIGGLSLVKYYQGKSAEAQALSEEGIRISQDIDNPWGVTYNEWRIAELEIDRGDYSRALTQLDARRAVARAIGFPVFIGMVISQAARAHLNLGRPDLALPLCDESADAFESAGQVAWTVWGTGVRALPRLRLGDVASARQLLEPLWHEGQDATLYFQGFVQAGPVIAEWALTDERIAFGLRFCDWLLSRLEAQDAHRLAGEMRYWRGRLRLAAGDAEGAQADLVQAREWLTRCSVLTLLAQVDEALALARAQVG
jgi:tetratricopeptide (TPR) repeat protein